MSTLRTRRPAMVAGVHRLTLILFATAVGSASGVAQNAPPQPVTMQELTVPTGASMCRVLSVVLHLVSGGLRGH